MTFEPHFMMRRCGSAPDSQACQDNCINKGRYCAMDTIDEEWAVHYKGWQVGPVLRVAGETNSMPGYSTLSCSTTRSGT